MKRLSLLATAILFAVTAHAAELTISLPAGVDLLKVASQADATVEVRLSAAALQGGIHLTTGASLSVIDGVCVILLPAAPDGAVNVRLGPPTTGAVQLTWAPTTIAGPAPALPPAPALTAAAPSPPPPPAPPAPPAPIVAAPPTPPAPPAPPVPSLAATTPAPSGAAPTLDGLHLPSAINYGQDPLTHADFAIPVSPAAAALGASSTLLRPASPRETVTDVLSHFNTDGKLLSGFSLAVTPYTLLRREPLTATEYQDDGFKRFLARTQLSLAALPDATPSGDARFSTGLSLVFFDSGDLRMDNALLARVGQVFHRTFSDADMLNGGTDASFTPAQFQQAEGLWNAAKAKNWNAASAGLGLAPVFLSAKGGIDDLTSDGLATWLTWATPGPGRLATVSQLLLGGSARFGQHTELNGTLTRGDLYDLAAQLRFGSPTFNGFAEVTYRRRSYDSAAAANTTTWVYEIGLEKRLNAGLWLNLSYGNDDAVTGGETVRTGLRYGFGDKAVLALP